LSGSNEKYSRQKPINIIETICKGYSNPGDIVLDPFLGSGTTAVAALRTGRRFIGIELSKEYCDIANKRIQQELSQPKLFNQEIIEKKKVEESNLFGEKQWELEPVALQH
jgi:site-specific DNA-methyltransferase (adenine-specific)